MTPPVVVTYRAAAPDTLLLTELPPFTAVFHRASGATHLLVEPAPEILTALAGEPLSFSTLRDTLLTQYELDDPAKLAERLDELVAAGLVERE